jgi:hypothetical protein
MRHSTLKTTLIFCLLLLTGTSVFAQSTDYLVNWDPNPEPTVTGYVIYISSDPNQGFAPLDSVDASTFQYLDTDRPKGVRLYYRIVAKDGYGNRSPFSNIVSGITIPQDADQATMDLCRIDDMNIGMDGVCDVDWSTQDATVGFVQYDTDMDMDSMTTWDDDQYEGSHTNEIDNLLFPGTYYVRAVSYDDQDNMIVSAVDTLVLTGENPTPLSAPALSIYPVPYHPNMGQMHLSNLPAGGSAVVVNGSGLEVWQAGVGDSTSLTWNGTNNQGQEVMSGVYYVLVRDSGGKIVERRPIMIVN